MLIALLAIGAALYGTTYAVTRAFHAREEQLADNWFQQGTSRLRSGYPNAAIDDFRSALLYSPANRRYRMSLAQALIATGRYDQADAHLRSLLEAEPGDGFLNLQLARVAVRRHNSADAQRFFHSAIYGIWEQDPDANRVKARLELIDFLLEEKRRTHAESELVALTSNLPRDRALLLRVGGLFAATGDYDHAIRMYSDALRLDPQDASALFGLGQAEFAVGRYAAARQHLQAAAQRDPANQHAAQLAQTATLVVQLNPYARVSAVERRRRVLRDFEIAGKRLQQCILLQPRPAAAPPAPAKAPAQAIPNTIASLQAQWSALRPKLNERAMRANPDLVDQASDLAFAIEQQTENQCGQPSEADRALLLILRSENS